MITEISIDTHWSLLKVSLERQKAPQVMKLKIEKHEKCVKAGLCPRKRSAASDIKCINGKADDKYDCNNVDLLSFTPIAKFGSSRRLIFKD